MVRNPYLHSLLCSQVSCLDKNLTIALSGRWINEFLVTQEEIVKTFSKLSWIGMRSHKNSQFESGKRPKMKTLI